MSTQKVTDLTALASAADDDVLLISDVSESESKKITVANLVNSKVNTAVSNLVDSAPAALDTLNELAAALGDDANFATTVTTSIGTKWTQDNTKISNWDTAYGWGNHASAGYLTSYTETDPVVGAVTGIVKADGAGNISAAVAGTDYLASYTETDPVFSASEAASITSTDTSNWDTAYGWGNHASAGYLTGITGQSIESLSDVNTMTPSDGQLLTWDNDNSRWDAADAPVSLPDQTGQSGNYLTTDGSTASWAALDTDANTTTKGLYEMANTISSNYSITSGNNALSAGPITINSGVSVTVPTGSTWVIAK